MKQGHLQVVRGSAVELIARGGGYALWDGENLTYAGSEEGKNDWEEIAPMVKTKDGLPIAVLPPEEEANNE